MTGPLVTWIVHLSFLQGVYSFLYCRNPYSHMKCLFTKVQSNIAIWQYIAIHSNTVRNIALTCIVLPLVTVCVDMIICMYIPYLSKQKPECFFPKKFLNPAFV